MAKIFAGDGSHGVGEGVVMVCTKFGADRPIRRGRAGAALGQCKGKLQYLKNRSR